jgi:SapC
MINQNLHKQAVGLDRTRHRGLRLDLAARDLDTLRKFNAFFVAGGEFGDACKDYPVVFVNAGQDDAGKPLVAPIAVFGLQPEQNLCIEGDQWRVRYVPAVLRMYPFAMARVEPDQLVLCFDEAWAGFNAEHGEALFDAQGEPTPFVLQVQQQLEAFEHDVERTRLACRLLLDKGLLREMRFDATLPDGQTLSVDGFLTVDDDKLRALSDADVLAFHKNGLMALVHAHQLSLGNMTRLVEWHVARLAQAPAQAAAPAA